MHWMAKKIGTELLKKNLIKFEEYSIYEYGLELLFSAILTSFSIILLSCFCDSILWGILYLVITIPLRMTAGGYHADTYTRCFLISNLTYISVSQITHCLLNLNLSTTSWLLILLSSTLFILANAPVQNKHHKISETKLKKNKLYCRIYSLADLILFSLLLDSPLLHPYICLSIISVMLVALLILPTQMRKEE